jgi:hypothetical protein
VIAPARSRAVLAAAVLAAAAPAAAAGPLPVKLTAEHGRLEASLDLSAAFPPSGERELGNGLTNVVAIYVSVVPAKGGPPALVYGRVVDILFDVWEETYAVTIKDPRTPQGTRAVFASFRALRAFLSDEKGLDLGPVRALPRGLFVVEARVEVNPVSKEQLQRTREFIANPAGGTRSGGGSRSVLGAMASFLLREPDAGSNVHLFRSRAFGPGEVAAR